MPLLWKTSILLAISHDSNILPAHLPHLPSRGGHICWNRIGDEHLNKTSDIIYTHASVVADGTLTDISDVRATKLTASSGRKPMPGRKESRPAGRLGRDISPHMSGQAAVLPPPCGYRVQNGRKQSLMGFPRSHLPNPADHMVRLGIAGSAWMDILRDPMACQKFADEIACWPPSASRASRIAPIKKNRRKTFLLNNLPFHVHSTLWQTSTNCSFAP